jgi:hypothetical protein
LYYRHELRRQPDGTLACADDFGGDVVTLTEAQAEAAMELTLPQEVQDGGRPGPRNEDTPPTINWPDGVEPAF